MSRLFGNLNLLNVWDSALFSNELSFTLLLPFSLCPVCLNYSSEIGWWGDKPYYYCSVFDHFPFTALSQDPAEATNLPW